MTGEKVGFIEREEEEKEEEEEEEEEERRRRRRRRRETKREGEAYNIKRKQRPYAKLTKRTKVWIIE